MKVFLLSLDKVVGLTMCRDMRFSPRVSARIQRKLLLCMCPVHTTTLVSCADVFCAGICNNDKGKEKLEKKTILTIWSYLQEVGIVLQVDL